MNGPKQKMFASALIFFEREKFFFRLYKICPFKFDHDDGRNILTDTTKGPNTYSVGCFYVSFYVWFLLNLNELVVTVVLTSCIWLVTPLLPGEALTLLLVTNRFKILLMNAKRVDTFFLVLTTYWQYRIAQLNVL